MTLFRPTPHSDPAAEQIRRRFDALVEHVADLVAVCDADGRVMFSTALASRLLGYHEAGLEDELIELVHPDDRPAIGEEWARVLARPGAVGTVEYRMRHADGRWVDVESVAVNRLHDPVVHGIVVTTRDIGERKCAAARQRHHEAIVDDVLDAIITTDLAGAVTGWNAGAAALFGWRPEEVIGRDVAAILWTEYLEGDKVAAHEELLRAGRWQGEIVQRRRDGSPVDVLSAVTFVRDENATPIGMVAVNRDISDRRRAELALLESERHFRLLADNTTDVIIRMAPDGRYLYASPSCHALLGYHPNELVGRHADQIIHPDDLERVQAARAELFAGGPPATLEFRCTRRDGATVWIESNCKGVVDELSGDVLEIQAVNRDICERKRAEALLADHAAVLALVAHGEPLRRVIKASVDLVERHIPGAACRLLPAGVAPEAGRNGGSSWSMSVDGAPGEEAFGSLQLVRPGHEAPTPAQWRIFEEAASLLSVAMARTRTEVRLARQALHDPLTGLPNRTVMIDRLERALERRAQGLSECGVVFVDLDDFKTINDSLGHNVGDSLLVEVAKRLQEAAGEDVTVCRFAGDEFVVLCEEPPASSSVVSVARSLATCLQRPFRVGSQELYLTASLGIAHSGRGSDSADLLLRNADTAMYQAKAKGKARTEWFDEAFRQRTVERLALSSALRGAADRGELRLEYQPTIDLATGRIAGVEALVRWEHPERGRILPSEFVPLAEETGVIGSIGEWVLSEACRHVTRWRATCPGASNLRVAVNLSARQLARPDLPETVAAVLALSGATGDTLSLAITETAIMDDADGAITVLQGLRDLGVRISVDDFGTGYSSLVYLRRLPVDALKVDRSFVDGLGRDSEDSAIVTSVVGLGQAMGLEVIAEGVETPEQLALLRELGCHAAQGYLIARPMPATELTELLQADPRW